MKVIVVSGWFDPIHIGHIEYFKMAKNLGDKLIVILNNDEQSKLKEGKGSSFMPLEERKIILQALQDVDEVFISIDKDISVIESLKALHNQQTIHIFAKGGDRHIHEIPETNICRELGIDIVDGMGKKIQSSSNFYNKDINS